MNKKNEAYPYKGVILSHKGEQSTDTCYNIEDPENIMLVRRSKTLKSHITGFNLYEIFRIGKGRCRKQISGFP